MTSDNSGKGGRLSLSRIARGPPTVSNKKITLAAVLLLSIMTISVLAIDSENAEAAPVSAVDIATDITALPDGGIYTMTGEPDDVVVLTLSDGNNRTIDGGGLSIPAVSGKFHFDITNTGTGTITFTNITLTNLGAYAVSGGINITGGYYVFDNCTFIGITNAGVFFNGNSNSADFIDCTFKNNTNKGIALSSGIPSVGTSPSVPAKFNIENCYFDSNTVTNSQGGAIGMNGNSYQYSITDVSISISGSLFTNNKAIGTSTVSGGNNTVDGGAVAVKAGGGNLTVTLDIWDCYFENNFAQDDGGAILVEGYAQFNQRRIASNIWNCTFTGNTAGGASYWGTYSGFLTAGITNGSGGAISYYGLTDSTVANCTFYNNGIINQYTGQGTNCGNAGGGGAIGVDTNDGITDPSQLPPVPILSNNIFIENYVLKNVSYVLPAVKTMFGDIEETPYTGNVFVMTGADADRQDPIVIARPITNNGNIGYDNGNMEYDRKNPGNGLIIVTNYANDLGTCTASGLTVDNIFANVVGGVPVKEALGDPVGASGNEGQRYYYMPSPVSDELYRDGSGPYYDPTHTVDAKGNPRDAFPNAGAIEIYWTKFDPGTEGDWATVPSQINNPTDPAKPYFSTESLKYPGIYYVSTDVGLPSPEIVAMPRSALIPDNAQYGFVGWRSSQPDLDWSDPIWTAANGTVSDYLLTHSLDDLKTSAPDAFPLYQPGQVVPSTKQTLIAEWVLNEYRVDFSLNYAEPPTYPDAADNYWLPSATDNITGGWTSAAGNEIPPYVGVPFGDRIFQPKADPIRDGFVFDGWYKESTLQTEWSFDADTTSGDIVLYAKWSLLTYSVTYHNNGATSGTAPVDGDSPYAPASSVIVMGSGTLVKTGYKFDGWSTIPNNSVVTHFAGDSFIIAANIDLYPVWTALSGGGGGETTKDYIINANADDGSTITPVGRVTVSGGNNKTFNYSPLSGYEIISIIIDGTDHPELIGTTSYTFYNVNMNHTISVISEKAEDGGNGGGEGETPIPPGPGESDGNGGSWAVLNLICAIVALLAGIAVLFAGRNRVRDEKDDAKVKNGRGRRSKPALILRVIGLILGIVSVIVFFLTEDWTLPVEFTDGWSLLMIVLLLAALIVSLLSFRFDRKDEDNRN